MIYGVGIDIEKVSRVKEVIERWDDAFIKRIFTENEQAYCTSKGNPSQHFAARFAAKEAFSKAIGTGWGGHFRWLDVEVINDSSGKPCLFLHNEFKKYFSSYNLNLSLSHTSDYAAAIVVVEERNSKATSS